MSEQATQLVPRKKWKKVGKFYILAKNIHLNINLKRNSIDIKIAKTSGEEIIYKIIHVTIALSNRTETKESCITHGILLETEFLTCRP